MPLGKFKDANYSTYNSGDISIVQESRNLKIKINNYKINGIFPHYNSAWIGAITERDRSKIYTENIGTFSIGYMQLFVPDNEASTIKDRNYYLTVSDNNINMTSITNEKITSQMKNSDDSQKVQHILYNPGSYAHSIHVFNQSGNLASTTYSGGDCTATLGETCKIMTKFQIGLTNDYDIYTANSFIKFDGEGFEPAYYSDGSKYRIEYMKGNPTFRLWYATKKDGKSRKQQRSTPDRIEGRSGARYICQFGYYNSFQFGIYSRLYPRDAWNAKGWRAIAHSFGTRTCQAFAACTRREYWEI